MDFAYALGVLHHVPDTARGIAACVRKLKTGAPLLLYLYYAFDNRPRWFKALWKVGDVARRLIATSPYPLKYAASQAIALLVYWPLAFTARSLERFSLRVERITFSEDEPYWCVVGYKADASGDEGAVLGGKRGRGSFRARLYRGRAAAPRFFFASFFSALASAASRRALRSAASCFSLFTNSR